MCMRTAKWLSWGDRIVGKDEASLSYGKGVPAFYERISEIVSEVSRCGVSGVTGSSGSFVVMRQLLL